MKDPIEVIQGLLNAINEVTHKEDDVLYPSLQEGTNLTELIGKDIARAEVYIKENTQANGEAHLPRLDADASEAGNLAVESNTQKINPPLAVNVQRGVSTPEGTMKTRVLTVIITKKTDKPFIPDVAVALREYANAIDSEFNSEPAYRLPEDDFPRPGCRNPDYFMANSGCSMKIVHTSPIVNQEKCHMQESLTENF